MLTETIIEQLTATPVFGTVDAGDGRLRVEPSAYTGKPVCDSCAFGRGGTRANECPAKRACLASRRADGRSVVFVRQVTPPKCEKRTSKNKQKQPV